MTDSDDADAPGAGDGAPRLERAARDQVPHPRTLTASLGGLYLATRSLAVVALAALVLMAELLGEAVLKVRRRDGEGS